MARHLQRKHMEESDVSSAFNFPAGSKQRKILLEVIHTKGDWEHNKSVLEGGDGEMITWKRLSKKAHIEDYLPCQHCYAMFKRKELWPHEKTCRNCSEEQGSGNKKQEVKTRVEEVEFKKLHSFHSLKQMMDYKTYPQYGSG